MNRLQQLCRPGPSVLQIMIAITVTLSTLLAGDPPIFCSTLGVNSTVPSDTQAVIQRTETITSAISLDVGFTSTADTLTDSSALRATAKQVSSGGKSAIRAGELHAIRGSDATQQDTWGLEVGVHSQVPGDGARVNVGIYNASSHAGWLASGTRADSGMLICGPDGWSHGLLYLDTDDSTVLADLDQYGGLRLGPFGILKTNGGAAPAANTFPGNQIFGCTNAATQVIGTVGEQQGSATSSLTNFTATATTQQLELLSLTAGEWDLYATVTISSNAGQNGAAFGISASSASFSGCVNGESLAYIAGFANATTQSASIVAPISITTPTTYYLNAQDAWSTGQPKYLSAFRAVRRR